MAMKLCTKLDVVWKRWPYCFPRSSTKFEGHMGQIADFDPNSAFPDCNFSLNSPVALKRCTKLYVVKKRCGLLFSEVMHQISRSHGLKNRWFGLNLSKITKLVAAIKSLTQCPVFKQLRVKTPRTLLFAISWTCSGHWVTRAPVFVSAGYQATVALMEMKEWTN